MQHSRHSPAERRVMAALMLQGSVDVTGASPVTPKKAKEMLRHGTVHGKPLSQKQRGLFGLIAGGGHPTRMG